MGATKTHASGNAAEVTSVDDRVLTAARACIARWGISKTTLDDVARESGVSRATIYRRFPGGKDVLVDALLTSEIERFFDEVGGALDAATDLEDLLVTGVGTALGLLVGHGPLAAVLQYEPELVLPQLAFHRLAAVLDATAGFAIRYLRPHVASDADARDASDHLVRVVLSYALYPSDFVDASDDASIHRLVRNHLLPGFTAASTAR